MILISLLSSGLIKDSDASGRFKIIPTPLQTHSIVPASFKVKTLKLRDFPAFVMGVMPVMGSCEMPKIAQFRDIF